MTGSAFFLRSRGKVSGPFDVEGLRRLVRQGALSRIHEISADRVTWAPAADYEELFPSRPASRAAAAPAPEAGVEPAFVASPPSGGEDARFYYSHNGAAVGPISLAVLKLLAQNRTLSGNDLVWREHAETGVPAAQMPSLASYFSAGMTPEYSTYAPDYPAYAPAAPLALPLSDGQFHRRQRAAQGFGSTASAIGVIGGGLVLLSLLLPWFSVGNQLFWWWDLYRVPRSGGWAAFCTYLTMAGIALCIVSPLTRGVARGTALVSISGAAFFFLIGAFLDSDAAGGPAFGVLVPVALAALLGVCSFRAEAPESSAGKVMLGIAGGIVTLGLLTSGIFWASQNGFPAGAPQAIVFGAVTVMAGAIAGLAAGVTALVGLKPHFTPELNRATRVCALAGLALPALGVFIACLGAIDVFSGLLPSSSQYGSVSSDIRLLALQALFRIVVIWAGVLAVFAAGLAELLMASSIGQNRRTM